MHRQRPSDPRAGRGVRLQAPAGQRLSHPKCPPRIQNKGTLLGLWQYQWSHESSKEEWGDCDGWGNKEEEMSRHVLPWFPLAVHFQSRAETKQLSSPWAGSPSKAPSHYGLRWGALGKPVSTSTWHCSNLPWPPAQLDRSVDKDEAVPA